MMPNVASLPIAMLLTTCLTSSHALAGPEPARHFSPHAERFGRSSTKTIPGDSSTILYNNFGPGDSYNTSASWIVGGFDANNDQMIDGYQDVACSFTVTGSSDVYLEEIVVAPAICSGQNAMDISLFDDNNGEPGQLREFWQIANQLGPCGAANPSVQLFSTGTKLSLGETYWIVLSHPATTEATGIWSFNDQDDNGIVAFRHNNGGWFSGTNIRPAMRVVANTSAPCPVTTALRDIAVDEIDAFISARGTHDPEASERELIAWRKASLRDIRGFRDEVMGTSDCGQRLTELYYTHAGEVAAILSEQPNLKRRARSLLLLMLPEVSISRDSGHVAVSLDEFRTSMQLLDELELHASPELTDAVCEVRRHLTSLKREKNGEIQIVFTVPPQLQRASSLYVGAALCVLMLVAGVGVRRLQMRND